MIIGAVLVNGQLVTTKCPYCGALYMHRHQELVCCISCGRTYRMPEDRAHRMTGVPLENNDGNPKSETGE